MADYQKEDAYLFGYARKKNPLVQAEHQVL